MGIRYLNGFLRKRNLSKNAMKKIHLKELSQKTIVIDASIYIYKFLENDDLINEMQQFIRLFQKYEITPIFVFDGKPPPEKKDIILQRKQEKKTAYQNYIQLQQKLWLYEQLHGFATWTHPSTQEIIKEMQALKSKFIRVKPKDILNCKTLMQEMKVLYYDAPEESDELCVFLVKMHKMWGCVSDDMDMLLYGCPNVIRHISIHNHTALVYDTNEIIKELKIDLSTFREMIVFSGNTEFGLDNEKTIQNLDKSWELYKIYKYKNKRHNKTFYSWLLQNNIISSDIRTNLEKICYQFDIVNSSKKLEDSLIQQSKNMYYWISGRK
jgi:flap endonuclease-1